MPPKATPGFKFMGVDKVSLPFTYLCGINQAVTHKIIDAVEGIITGLLGDCRDIHTLQDLQKSIFQPSTVEIIAELKLDVADSTPATALDQPITAVIQQSLNQTMPKVQSATTYQTRDSSVAAPSFSGISDFESELLRYPANSFTVQIMGSRSEASVRDFVSGEVHAGKPGYFETRFQDRPWFVVVLGNFGERHEAVAAIEELPESLRSLKPWIRSLADVQSDIRKLHASN